ncbi:MAG: ATP12 family chaperone protein, partial [Rhabdaerophilum sp.]
LVFARFFAKNRFPLFRSVRYLALMRDEFTKDWFGDGQDPASYDPVRAARGAMKSRLPKRFYETVTTAPTEGGHALLLDGKPARTKGKNPLAAPNASLAKLIAAEWAAQDEFIDPATMPLTRIAHAALDHVSGAMQEVRADILKYAASDLVCYRAADPVGLVELQERLWNPVLAHIEARYGASFVLSEGVRHVTQPDTSLRSLEPRLETITEPMALAALHVLTTISGSALIAISVADGMLDAASGFDAGECDADYEAGIWGFDEEAAERRANRLADFAAATQLLRELEN